MKKLCLALAVCLFAAPAAAEESWTDWLNPFAKKENTRQRGRRPTTLGLPGLRPKQERLPRGEKEPSLLERGVSKVGDVTKDTVDVTIGTLDKTRKAILPTDKLPKMKLPSWGGGKSAAPEKKRSRWSLTSWMKPKEKEEKDAPKSVNDWLSLPPNMPE